MTIMDRCRRAAWAASLCIAAAHGALARGAAPEPPVGRSETAARADALEETASRPSRPDEKLLADLWRDLGGENAAKADASARQLASKGAPAAAFLAKQFRRAPLDSARVRKLIADLDADAFQTREAASAALRQIGLPAAALLRGALAKAPSAEAQVRIERLLAELERAGTGSAEAARYRRAVKVLVLIGSKQALLALKDLAVVAPTRRIRDSTESALVDVAEVMINSLLTSARAKVKAGDLASAAASCREALAAATTANHYAGGRLRSVLNGILARQKLEKRLADLLARAKDDPADADARKELVWLYLVEKDAPGEAVRYLPAKAVDPMHGRVRLAAAGVSSLSAEAAMDLGRWYEGLAGKASTMGKAAMLRRARACYRQCLARLEIPRAGAAKAMGEVEARLAKLVALETLGIRGKNLAVNAGFETARSQDRWPGTYGVWSGNRSTVVGRDNGIVPWQGARMLRFDITSWGVAGPCAASDVMQIIDVTKFRGAIRAGKVRAFASARFNRVAGHARTDTEFRVRLAAYAGALSGHFALVERAGYLSLAHSPVRTDADPTTWEKASTTLVLPKATDYLVVWVSAIEDVHNDLRSPEFDGHYADDVFVSVVAAEDP